MEDAGDLLFSDPDDNECRGILQTCNGSRVKCKQTRISSHCDIQRRCTLVTLNHGTIWIVLLDWVCGHCKFENPYLGFPRIFPTVAGVAFKVELLYYWINKSCNGTRSFRYVYTTTTKLRHSPSCNRSYERERMFKMGAWHQSNRRFGNDALRRFIQLVDLDSESITGKIFT